MIAFLARLRRKKPSRPPACMAVDDQAVIRKFARGDERLRMEAIAIHRRYQSIFGWRGTPEQRFMAEVDNPVPDVMLRAHHRRALIET